MVAFGVDGYQVVGACLRLFSVLAWGGDWRSRSHVGLDDSSALSD